MLFGDNQTKHFYVGKAIVQDLANSDLFRLKIVDADTKDDEIDNATPYAVSDVINKRLIKRAKITEVKPTYFRKWVVKPMTSVEEGKTYHLYFYLENLYGFGIQDRWDRVASYTAKTNGATTDSVQTVMTELQKDLALKLNAGAIKGDFVVDKVNTNNEIIIRENPDSETFNNEHFEMEMLMHTNLYAYNVMISTSVSSGNETLAWEISDGTNTEEQKMIYAENAPDVYITAAKKVLAMEMYFLRNRGDLYQLTKPFGISIINDTYTNKSATKYFTLDIDYAFSDTQGYTNHSDKQITIAHTNKTFLKELLGKILADANESSLQGNTTVPVTNNTATPNSSSTDEESSDSDTAGE